MPRGIAETRSFVSRDSSFIYTSVSEENAQNCVPELLSLGDTLKKLTDDEEFGNFSESLSPRASCVIADFSTCDTQIQSLLVSLTYLI
jgi:hypothetical protein